MKTWDIWSEGYQCTGDRSGALLHGQAEGRTFKEACQRFAYRNPAFLRYFDDKHMTYWGCRLFNNERDARKVFG